MTVESLKLILWAMSHPGTVYILGAGASYGLIPFTPPGLRRIMAAEFHIPGIYSIERPIATNLYRRVMAGGGRASDVSEALFRQTISDPALRFLFQRAMWRPMGKDVPANYRVFQLVAPSVLFSFNLDGMAKFYCGNRHIVFEPHGTIDSERFASGIYGDLLDATIAYDLVLPDIRYKLLPGPEPSCITRRFAYRALPRSRPGAESVEVKS